MGDKRRLILALLIAPVVGGVVATTFGGAMTIMHPSWQANDLPGSALRVFAPIVPITLTLSLLIATIGLLAHTILQRLRIYSVWAYTFAGALCGLWLALLGGFFISGGNPLEADDTMKDLIGILPIALVIGSLTAATAWFVRRPDRVTS